MKSITNDPDAEKSGKEAHQGLDRLVEPDTLVNPQTE